MSDDRTPMQRALDAEAQVADLAKRVAELEAALRPFADGNIDVSGAAVILGYPECKEALRVARDALSAPTPSVGGSLAEENERLREALEVVDEYLTRLQTPNSEPLNSANQNNRKERGYWIAKVRNEAREVWAIVGNVLEHGMTVSQSREASAAALSGKEPT